MVVVGSDLYISSVLRPYVDQFSSKPPDFQNHIRFLIIPLGKYTTRTEYRIEPCPHGARNIDGNSLKHTTVL